MICNRTKVFRFLLLAFLLLSALFACQDLFGPLDNPVDRESENYQGYDTILDKDNIELFFPTANSRLAGIPTKFTVSEVINASAYQIQISGSQSDFENNILFNKSDYASNRIDIDLQSLSRGIWYYWRARAQQGGEWGKWTKISSFIIGYTITYDGNGNKSGTVPTDTKAYIEGDTVTVLGNTGRLAKAGYSFAGWNAKSDGSGTSYQVGSTFTMGSSNISLYAEWTIPSYVLFATGYNYYGQLGNGTNTSRSTPVKVMENVQSVSAGEYHTMILKNDGSLWATGGNWYGQLGDGTNSDRSTPVQVMENVQYVSAGGYHTMIIKNDGSLWATGWNSCGELGDGTYSQRSMPAQVMENVQSVSASEYHTMILKKDGSLWAAGYNSNGQLGDGTCYDRSTPVQVMENVQYVSAGGYHTMIIKNDGGLWATGYNGSGQFGDGTNNIIRSTPIKVMENVQSVSAGEYHTMILKNDGSLWATGRNNLGQLGDGTYVDRSTPVQVMENVQSVSAGYWHTMILKNDGSLWATGWNYHGQLGDGTYVDRSTPIKVMENVQSISAGWGHTMILYTEP